jgi:putative membrane protein
MGAAVIAISLAAAAGLYARGVRRLWRASRPGRGLRWSAAASFTAGLLVLAVSLLSPMHHWGEEIFAAHMVQHELMMLVAAPLLVGGRPLVAFSWGLPRGLARGIAGLTHRTAWRRSWRFLAAPVPAWTIHAAILWGWHLPSLFQATLTSDVMHALQHTSFMAAALLFWWSLRERRPRERGIGLLYLFTTLMHTGLLGALLTFAPHPWYPAYALTTARWGLTPLEDQQLGGLIMWIPAGLVYVGAGLFLFHGWLREADRKARGPERVAATWAGIRGHAS